MPKVPEVSSTYLISELKNRPDIFHEDGSLKQKSCEIWKDIQQSLSLRMLPQSLFFFVYKNKSLIHELRRHFKNNIVEEKKVLPDSDPSYIPHWEIHNPHNCQQLEFSINLPRGDLLQCSETKKKNEDWTDNVRDEILNIKSLPCPFALNGYATNEEFKFVGQCRECKTGITGKSINLKEDVVKIRVKTFKTSGIPYSKKLKLQGARRRRLKGILSHQTVRSYREEQLEKVTTKYEPPHLNDSITLRKAREEGLDELIGYKEFKGLSITNQKFIVKCSVRNLSVNPFYIIYFSEDQLNFWNKVQSKMLPLSFDSTGSLAQKYCFYTGIKSKTLFYYVLVVGIAGKIIPLLQAILSVHHVSAIQQVLDVWIQCGAKRPREISTDGSLALQNSINLSFNNMTYKEYNNKCFKILIGKKNDTLPPTFYRHDVAHLLKNVAEWKCIKETNEVVRNFYLRAAGYLTQVESLYEFVDIVTCIIVIANGQLVEEGTKPYLSLQQLMKLFQTYEKQLNKLTVTQENYLNKIINPESDNVEPEVDMSCSSIVLFTDNLFSKALSDCSSDTTVSIKANFYHCPDFNKLFKTLCYTFPSWTNCTKSYFHSLNKVGTSTRSETNFRWLKSYIPHPLKVQKLVLKDVKRNSSLVKAAFMKLEEEEENQEKKVVSLFDLNLDGLIATVINKTKKLNLKESELQVQNASNNNMCSITVSDLKTSSPTLPIN